MSAYWSSAEGQARGRVKPVERPRGPLTFFFTFLQPVTFAFLSTLQEQPMGAATRKHPHRPPTAPAPEPVPTPPPRQLENIFINALVQSCACQRHVRPSPSQSMVRGPTYLYHKARRRFHGSGRQFRPLHGKATPPVLRTPASREEYMSLVDLYRETFSTKVASADNEPFRFPSKSEAYWATDHMYQLREPVSEASREISTVLQPVCHLPFPSASVSATRESSVEFRPTPSNPLELPEPMVSMESPKTLAPPYSGASGYHELEPATKLLNVLKDDECTHEAAFEAYSALPSPGILYLSDKGRRLLFRRMSVMERKDKDSMLRYLSIVDDMKSADFKMTESEWNSAIAFCGQCFTRISAADMESALRTWKEMEQEAAVTSGNVTFNILFDMAAKAGKFVLAEMILTEMEARKLSFNRYARVSYIYYNGLRADGDGVRRAYRDFVQAGEIVTPVVLNCVIASLIRAGEPAAAEQVYERMKQMLAKRTGKTIPNLNWKQTRSVGRLLDKAARNFKYDPVKLQQLRDEQVLAPNLHTFAIFMEYHASQTGEFLRIVALLTEMQHLGVPMHGRIFVKIFKGFAIHGGQRYSKWTRAHLESVWNAWLDAIAQGGELKLRKWAVVWLVRAFDRCAGRDRTLEVWGELRSRREPDDCGQIESAMDIVRDILTASQI